LTHGTARHVNDEQATKRSASQLLSKVVDEIVLGAGRRVGLALAVGKETRRTGALRLGDVGKLALIAAPAGVPVEAVVVNLAVTACSTTRAARTVRCSETARTNGRRATPSWPVRRSSGSTPVAR
jgi:hypothetical protein